MKRISDQVKFDIISLLHSGVTPRNIARKVGASRTTVERIRRNIKVDIPRGKRGRPKKLSVNDKRKLVRMVTSGVVDTAVQLKKELQETTNTVVSTQTIRRALKNAGLVAATKIKKPRLSAKHIRQRLRFAELYKDWTVDDWKRVVWSDETKINRLGSDGRDWVWKRRGIAIAKQHVKGTVKYGGGSTMIWGCMMAQGIGYACHIDGKMNAEGYTNILNENLMNSLLHYGLNADDIIFQQDNDPKHTSRRAIEWLRNHNIRTLEWPAQSPDLNPIEHLWQHLKQQLAKYETDPTSIFNLRQRIETEWSKISPKICCNLVESMPRRIAEVLKAKGGYTKY